MCWKAQYSQPSDPSLLLYVNCRNTVQQWLRLG